MVAHIAGQPHAPSVLLTLIVHQVAYCLFKEHVSLLRLYYSSIKALLRLAYCLFKEHVLQTSVPRHSPLWGKKRKKCRSRWSCGCLFQKHALHMWRMRFI